LAWTSFWYNYAVGGLIFFIGLVFTIRQGVVGLRDRQARRNLILLVGGFVFFFGLHLTLMILGSVG